MHTFPSVAQYCGIIRDHLTQFTVLELSVNISAGIVSCLPCQRLHFVFPMKSVRWIELKTHYFLNETDFKIINTSTVMN